MKILVVDDDREQRELRALILNRNGFDAIEASDCPTAKRLANQHHPLAAVVDLGLPKIENGLELIRDLKAIDSGMRVLVLTGSARRPVQIHDGAELIDDFFIKPASTADLIERLRYYESALAD